MREHRNPCPSPPPTPVPAATLVRVGPSLAVCVVCGHEHTHRGERVTCRDCGSTGWRLQVAGAEAGR